MKNKNIMKKDKADSVQHVVSNGNFKETNMVQIERKFLAYCRIQKN